MNHKVLILFVALGAGCEVERFFPEEVGDGAARLTISNAGNLLAIVNADTGCGFESTFVKQGFVVDGEVGQQGSVTWTVHDCTIDFGSIAKVVGTDCNGKETTAVGKVTVDATRTIEGLLTGDQDTPVIPQSPDAVHLTLSAHVKNYEIRSSGSDKSALMIQGDVDVAASIHLATSASLGVCSVPTGAVTLDSVTVKNAAYEIHDGASHTFAVDVPSVEAHAQVGQYGDQENFIAGKITVWDKTVDLAHDAKLDPAYDRKSFEDSFACTEDLQLPIAYDCGSLKPLLAEGAAKLTINDVGNITSVFSKDTTCGLASPAAKASAVVEGEVGRDGGSVTFNVLEPCVIDFGEATPGRTDCNGDAPLISGRASFTGSLTVHGRITGNPDQPVIPSYRDAVDIALHLDLDHAQVRGADPRTLEIVHGSVSGVMHPRMAIDTSSGACAIDTPVVTFEDVQWAPGTQALVHTEQGALGLTIDGSSLQAQNGNKDGVENRLTGSIDVDGEHFEIPLHGEPVLDPDYDAARFLSSFACEEHLLVPESDADCNMHQTIADGVARLVVQTVGTVAGAVNDDSNCGYANTTGVLLNPSQVVGAPGEMGSLTWDVAGCGVGVDALSVFATDCSGGQTFWQGHATMDSERTVRGLREVQDFVFLQAQSIAPQDPSSIDLTVSNVQLDEFASFGLAAGESEPQGVLTIHSGVLEAQVEPVTGYSQEQDRFTVPSPMALMSGVRLHDAHATLQARGMTFEIDIPDTNIFAVNGAAGGFENHIEGTVNIDGDDVTIGGDLNPEYDRQALDASWACNTAATQGCSQSGAAAPALASLAIAAIVLRRRRRR